MKYGVIFLREVKKLVKCYYSIKHTSQILWRGNSKSKREILSTSVGNYALEIWQSVITIQVAPSSKCNIGVFTFSIFVNLLYSFKSVIIYYKFIIISVKMAPKINKNELEETVRRVVEDTLRNEDSLKVLANLIKETIASVVIAELQSTIETNTAVIKELQCSVKEKDKKIEELEGKLDDLEQYQRRQCLRIFGVKEEETEDTDKIVAEVSQKIGAEVQACDIDRSHRVGRRDGDRPRPIIVKFVSYRKRSEVYRNKRQLKGSGITIREDLTRQRHGLLREAITKFGLHNVWTQDGVIVVKDGETKKRVTRRHEL